MSDEAKDARRWRYLIECENISHELFHAITHGFPKHAVDRIIDADMAAEFGIVN